MASVRIDDEQAAYDITSRLLRLGHRDIGFVRLPRSKAAESRFRGHCRALAEQGLESDGALVWEARPTFDAGLALAEKILPGQRPFTAIIAGNDDMAAAFVNVALRHDVAIPGDISIIGFDDTPIAVKIWPALTTVRQPLALIAEQATERLVELLRIAPGERQVDLSTSYVDYSVVDRSSVGPVPVT